jgi:hypothetical protein
VDPFDLPESRVIGEEGASTEIAVDLYLDATTSMEGYIGADTEYAEFLRALEASLVSRWSDAQVRRFKFGTRVDSIGREEYLSARDDLRFYREPGVFERTQIDSVLARTDADRVAVVVTDLFQDAGDTTALVDLVKARVFERGLGVAVLPIESHFDGTVYDAPGGPYRYASTDGDPATYRPFYALAFGAPAQIERLVETLDGRAGVRRDRSLLVAPYVVEDFELELAKSPGDDSRGLNVASANDGGYRFVVRDGYEGGTLTGTLRTTPRPGAPVVDPARVDLAAFRRDAARDSAGTSDLTLSNVRRDGNDFLFDLSLVIDGPPGHYAYLALFQAGALDGLTPPPWTRELSTTAPTADVDPNKTLNLERLTRDLIQTAATVQRPLIGRALFSVTKQ